jgi:hypothetical protein
MSTNIDEMVPVEDRWWEWSRRHPMGSIALAGFVAVQMATIVGYFLRGIGLPQVPWPLFNGVLFAPKTDYGTAASFFVGQSIHMVDGVVFALLFAVLAYGMLPFARTSSVLNGITYSMILAVISAGFLVPYVYVPKSGFGFFSFYSPDHWKLPVSIAIFHLVYGYFLGVLYNPAKLRVAAVVVVVE